MGTKKSASPTYFKPAPSEIQYGKMRYLITDRPTDLTIHQFIQELGKHNVRAVVRVCEPTYATEPLRSAGINVLDWEFNDGSPPPKEVIDKWLALSNTNFRDNPETCIAVHCVAGLGRAPVMVAIALMEAGMKYEDAVDLIRQNRRGAINQKQLTFLEKYKSSGQLRKLKNGARHKDCCLM
uniref:Protein tyrosine phosphatase type IVA 3 n=1 Tax=Plectus sambesii TaxID=2011161 RepID=A0A914VVD1_9BILA